MDKHEYKLKRSQAELAAVQGITQDVTQAAVALVNNPMVSLIGGIYAVALMKRAGLVGWLDSGIIDTALLGNSMINALGKSQVITQLAQAGGNSTSKAAPVIRDVLPLLLAAGGAA